MRYFSIFGDPVSHSISPLMHNYAIKGLKLDACYSRFHLKDGKELREKFFKLGIDGANITVPHKEVAFEICDEIRGIANEIKTVNTIVKEGDKLIGYNTDAPGFYESIKEYDIKKALIIGAGGTAKALAYYLREKNIDITVLNRGEERLKYFDDRGFKTHSWDNFENSNFELVINTTSAGLEEELLPAPKEILDEVLSTVKYAVDVIYNKKTPFLKEAKKYNISIKDGSEMLLYQGVLAFNYFYGGNFSVDEITNYMKSAFSDM